MRLVHLSDLHLGFRQYQRLTPTGINQREADVARTFQKAVDQVIALRPELIIVSGDVFHVSRPPNAAILHAFNQFGRIRRALPASRVVVVAGNHDTPRTTESGTILKLFEALDVSVAADDVKRIRFDELGVSVLAVPDVAGPPTVYQPDPTAKHNILTIHADVEDVVPRYYAELDRAAVRVTRSDLKTDQWSYVALGHYHVHQRVAPNAFYAGSLDFTSLNVWYDLEEQGKKGKGFVEFDLDTGKAEFHTVEPTREFIELREIGARDMTPAEVDAAIRQSLDKVKGGIDDKVVRLVIRDIPRSVARELDHRAIRDYKKRALSFVLDARKPEPARRDASGAPTRRPAVIDVVREQLRTRPIPADLDRDRLVDLGMRYLSEADAFPVAAAGAPTADAER
jgi:DNA repair protein SbcD/Mre11